MSRELPRMTSSDRPPLGANAQSLATRLAATETRLRQLETACDAIIRDGTGCALGPPCPACDGSLLLIGRGTMYCPACRDRRTL